MPIKEGHMQIIRRLEIMYGSLEKAPEDDPLVNYLQDYYCDHKKKGIPIEHGGIRVEFIQKIMRENEISLVRLSQEIGISRTALYNRLIGKSKFNLQEVVAISKVLRTDLKDLTTVNTYSLIVAAKNNNELSSKE